MDLGKSELAALSRMFSAAVVRELGRTGESALFSRLLTQTGFAKRTRVDATVGDVFDDAFTALSALGNRDEYVYRTAITQKILLGRHSLRTASMLSEVRVGTCKADVVVLNGTATAYEIKSERDSLARVANQVHAYGRVFAAVNVVTSPSYMEQVKRQVPERVGVLVLSERYTLQTERDATIDPGSVESLAVLDFVRIEEAFNILRALGIEPPRVPNTQMRAALRGIFSTLDPARVHAQMVRALKLSRSQMAAASFIETIPMSLRAAILTLNMGLEAEENVRGAMLLPLGAALAWS